MSRVSPTYVRVRGKFKRFEDTSGGDLRCQIAPTGTHDSMLHPHCARVLLVWQTVLLLLHDEGLYQGPLVQFSSQTTALSVHIFVDRNPSPSSPLQHKRAGLRIIHLLTRSKPANDLDKTDRSDRLSRNKKRKQFHTSALNACFAIARQHASLDPAIT